MNTQEFIEKAKKIHGDKYDYSKVEYKGAHTKVCIICPEHGEFCIRVSHFLAGHRCPKCAGNAKLTTDEFIKKAREIHGDKYDYSKVEYKNYDTKVCIICPKHGEFWQTPYEHLVGHGCPKCAKEKQVSRLKSSTEDFIHRAKEVHGDRYDYSKVEYVNNHIKVCIICPEHGEFWQTPNVHINRGSGCPKCAVYKKGAKSKLNKEEFIRRAKEVHGDKYDYSKVEYINSQTKVCIICPEHGEFWQTPSCHLKGQGCPKCCRSILEENVAIILNEKNINYTQQKTFSWLKNKNKLRLDFYLPDYNIAIECQGGQHFMIAEGFGGKEEFENVKYRDLIKNKLCKENNIRLIYITNKKFKRYLNQKQFNGIYDNNVYFIEDLLENNIHLIDIFDENIQNI